MELDESVNKYISEKSSEKLQKLKAYDVNILEECVQYGYIKIAQPIVNMESLGNKSKYHDTRQIQKELAKQFNKARNLNYTEYVLQLYDNLDVIKFAKLMNITDKQANDYLSIYDEWKNPDVTYTTIGRTFFNNLQTDLRRVHFTKSEDGLISILHFKTEESLQESLLNLNSSLLQIKSNIKKI